MKHIKFLLTLALLMTAVIGASAYDLKVGTNEHGSVTFKVNNQTVTTANEGDEVTVVVTPNEGYSTGSASGQWFAAMAKQRTSATIGVLKEFSLNAVSGDANAFTFTMERANAEVSISYRKLLSNTDISIADIADVTYTGSAQTPTITVKDGTTTLAENSDYTVAYADNTNAGTGKVTVTGIGNYDGTKEVTFTITPAALTEVTLTATEFTYNKAEQTAEVSSVKAGELDVDAESYEVSGNKATEVGVYTVTVTGKGNFTGTATAQYSIVAADAKLFEIALDPTEFTYDGTEKKPTVTVKDGEKTLTADTDYTLAYENNVNAGTGKVTVTGKGDYSGTKTAEFTILQAAGTIGYETAAVSKVYSNETFTNELTVVGDGTVAYTSSDEQVATVDAASGEVTIKGLGTATITATISEGTNYTYAEKTAQYELTVEGLMMTIAAGEYADYYGDKNLKLAYDATDAKLYTVSAVDRESVTLAEITVAQAESPMLVFNSAAEEKTFILIPTDEAPANQAVAPQFNGTLTAKEMPGSSATTEYYICTGKNFVRVKGAGTAAANSCWLELSNAGSANAPSLSILIDTETTDIRSIENSQLAADNWYDMNGRKLQGKPAAKGLYINNGRKVVIK